MDGHYHRVICLQNNQKYYLKNKKYSESMLKQIINLFLLVKKDNESIIDIL